VIALLLAACVAAEVPVTGDAVPALAGVDAAMTKFVEDNAVPGVALAVSHQGGLIYSRGFGYSDREQKEVVTPDALFRIASVSKPLTGVAVVKLAEMGKLDLDAPAFAFLGLALPKDGDARLNKVTIRHLLHHTGGWDRSKSFDPMFRPREIAKEQEVATPAGPDAVIAYMLKRPLDHDPGATYAYSNFGYCILGRVIEKASGVGYEAFVKKHVLEPAGAKGVRLGRSLLENRAPGEVRYYARGDRKSGSVFGEGGRVPVGYGGWNLEAMDAHGGWLASAPDLVRFADALDRPAEPILTKKSVDVLFGGATKVGDGVFYACGWTVRPKGDKRTTWHNGKLDGTATLLARRWDGVTFAVLFNADENKDGKYLIPLVEGPVHAALDAVKDWPK